MHSVLTIKSLPPAAYKGPAHSISRVTPLTSADFGAHPNCIWDCTVRPEREGWKEEVRHLAGRLLASSVAP